MTLATEILVVVALVLSIILPGLVFLLGERSRGRFKGALAVRASDINEDMKLAAALAIASLVSDDELQDYSNPVSAKIEEWQNAIRDRYEIYRKDPSKGIDISDFAWYLYVCKCILGCFN